jgi:hypothetical protein
LQIEFAVHKQPNCHPSQEQNRSITQISSFTVSATMMTNGRWSLWPRSASFPSTRFAGNITGFSE